VKGNVGLPFENGLAASDSMPAVGIAICSPSRSDRIIAKAARIYCLAFGPNPIGHSALAAPTSPIAKVQIVSTRPALPVRCWTSHAPAMVIESESAIPASAAGPEIIQNPC
jgi:hypothetical protein